MEQKLVFAVLFRDEERLRALEFTAGERDSFLDL